MNSLCFFGEGTVTDEIRMDLSARILAERGYTIVNKVNFGKDMALPSRLGFDTAVLCRPHNSTLISELKNRRVRIIVDIDDDFWHIPSHNIAFNSVGKGNPHALKEMERCLELADVITTPSPVLKRLLCNYNNKVPIMVVPNGWSRRNKLWFMPRSKQYADTINFGWAGTVTHRMDFNKYLSAIRDFLLLYENTRIIIGQDSEIYRLFKDLPENRKVLLPALPYSMYPMMFSYIDVWMAPLLHNVFNECKSDIKLVDAGAHNVPWIASDLPAYRAWEKGGIIADTPDEWYEAMKTMMDQGRRIEYAHEGNVLAQSREQEQIVNLWDQIIRGHYVEI